MFCPSAFQTLVILRVFVLMAGCFQPVPAEALVEGLVLKGLSRSELMVEICSLVGTDVKLTVLFAWRDLLGTCLQSTLMLADQMLLRILELRHMDVERCLY